MSANSILSRQFDVVVEKSQGFRSGGSADATKKLFDVLWSQFENIETKVDQLHLFSTNESLEDVLTENLKYLAVPFHEAKFLEQHGGVGTDKGARLANLLKADSYYVKYLHRAQDYGVLDKAQSERLDSFKESYQPTFAELEIKDPVLRRQAKIENYKRTKALKQALKVLEDRDAMEGMGEEVVRQIYTDQLQYYVLETFQSLEGNLMEVELLKNMARAPQQPPQIEDRRERSRTPGEFDKGYTDRVESAKPAISKDGKVLRPFTIVPSHQKRAQFQASVQGTGQQLPTMTVDEFVDHELQNGGMVKSAPNHGIPEEKSDEDDYEELDRETYRQREMDDFKDYHAKGSGNLNGNMG